MAGTADVAALGAALAKLGFAPGQVVQELGWDEDADDAVRFGIEDLTGSAYADRLTGNSAANVLNGGARNDTLDGSAGIDTMIGGDGNDSFVYASMGNGLDSISDFADGDRITIVGTTLILPITSGDGTALQAPVGQVGAVTHDP